MPIAYDGWSDKPDLLKAGGTLTALRSYGQSMNLARGFCIPMMLGLTITAAVCQRISVPDGAITDQRPCVFGPYEEQSKFTKKFYSRQDYDLAKSSSQADCSRIRYRSDGLNVIGFLVRPRDVRARRFPVILFNRGGFLERGKIESFHLVDLTRLAEQGFVVLASQYRGNDGGEGRRNLAERIWTT